MMLIAKAKSFESHEEDQKTDHEYVNDFEKKIDSLEQELGNHTEDKLYELEEEISRRLGRIDANVVYEEKDVVMDLPLPKAGTMESQQSPHSTEHKNVKLAKPSTLRSQKSIVRG